MRPAMGEADRYRGASRSFAVPLRRGDNGSDAILACFRLRLPIPEWASGRGPSATAGSMLSAALLISRDPRNR